MPNILFSLISCSKIKVISGNINNNEMIFELKNFNESIINYFKILDVNSNRLLLEADENFIIIDKDQYSDNSYIIFDFVKYEELIDKISELHTNTNYSIVFQFNSFVILTKVSFIDLNQDEPIMINFDKLNDLEMKIKNYKTQYKYF